MEDFLAQYTDDGSVGLFNKEVGDIYHSKYGALSESYEKFILPSNVDFLLKKNNKIKILDICFGIGYNSKAFLNYFIKKYHEKKLCINSIDTDNIFSGEKEFLHDEKGKNKKNKTTSYEIILHGVDIDKNLIKISPFIKQYKNFKIKNKHYYIKDEVNIILLKKIFDKFKNETFDINVLNLIQNKTIKNFFSKKMVDFALNYQKWGYQSSQNMNLSTLLHNIYYEYISNSYKNAIKILKTHTIDIQLYCDDARSFISSSNDVYDLIFLDAFSPIKAPSLWTIEFFNELYNHSSDDCMILTYSNSAAIRNAFLKNNFYVGKIYNSTDKKFVGTIAAKNKMFIINPLDEFDLGLMNTKSGICFRDVNLSLSNSEILKNRTMEVEKSNLSSTSHYKKEFKCHTM